MADQRERIVLEVDASGVPTAVSSANREIKGLESQFSRAGQTLEQKLLAKIATLQGRMAGDPMRLKELDTLQQRVLSKMAAGADAAGSKFSAMGEKIKNAIQNPMQAAGDAVGGLVTKLGPLGVGLSIGAAAIGMIAKTTWDWAKGLGQLGDQIENTAVRMGLNNGQVQALGFAMKRSGSDMSELEGITRKLSQEVDSGGENLDKMGVKWRDVRTGEAKPMYDMLLSLGDALAAMPNEYERNNLAAKAMGRGFLGVLPHIMELRENLERFPGMKIGLTDAQIDQMNKWKEKIGEVESKWDDLVTKFKMGVVATVEFASKRVYSEEDMRNRRESTQPPPRPPGVTSAYADSLIQPAWIARNDEEVKRRLQSTPEEELSVAKSKLAGLAKDMGYGVMLNPGRLKAFDEQKAIVKSIESRIEAIKKLEQAEKDLKAFEDQATERSMGPASKIFDRRDEIIKAGANALRATNAALVEAVAAMSEPYAAMQKDIADRSIKTWKDYEADFQKSVVDPMSAGLDRFSKAWLEKVKDIRDKARKTDERAMSDIEAGATHQVRMGELSAGPGQELAAIQQTSALRVQAAKDEFAIVEAHSHLYDMDEQRWKLQKEMQAAGYEYEEKVAELQKSRFENLRSSMEGLLDAAFARSKSILDALKGMAQAVFLTPIKQGISSMMANAMMPLMYGKSGNGGIMGGISGMFGGGGINGVRLVNGAVPVCIVGAGGAGAAMARGGEVIGAGGSTAGLTRLASGLWDRTGGMGGAGGGMAAASEIVGGPGGTSGFAGPVGGGGGAAAASGGGGIGSWAKSASGYGGFKGMLGNLGNIGMGGKYGTDAAGSDVFMPAKGVGGTAGGAMLLGGGILAADGLRRGGWAGVGETAAGGALIGAKFGGPMGALIGGLAGFGAGIARLFIKGAAEKVQEKVKTIYGLTIDKKMGQQIADMAKQKYGGNLDMAVRASETRDLLRLYAQTMGQKVPASLMADQSRGGSLIQSRGELFQAPVYDNGTAYSYASSLRTYGGVATQNLSTAGQNAGGPTYVSLHVDGQGAGAFMDGRFVPNLGANSRVVAASALRGNAATSSRAGNAVLTLAPSVIVQ